MDVNKLQRFLRLSPGVKWSLPEAVVLTACYRYIILHRPFARISPAIGTVRLETPEEAPAQAVWDVKKTIEVVSKRMPWSCTCLVQALTAKKMLNRRGLRCTLYMGVATDSAGKLEAHAWLRCGKIYVTGGNGSTRYTVTAIYGDAPRTEKGTNNGE